MTKPATKPVPSPSARVDRPRGALEFAVRTRNGDSTTTNASAMRPIVSRARKAYPAPMAAPTRAAAHDARSSRARGLRSLPGGGAELREVVHGQHEEVAEDDARASAAEERELLRDRRIGADPVLDLVWPEDEAVASEAKNAQLAVLGRVGAAGDPGDHVVALAAGRGHGNEEQEFAPVRPGQARGDVVRLDRHPVPALRQHLGRSAPRVGAVVELVGIGHVVE